MKKSLFLFLILIFVYLFSITQSRAQPNTNPLDDLFDNQRHGLFLGATVGYGVTQSGLSIAVDRFNEDDKFDNSNSRGTSGSISWRIGYAVSERQDSISRLPSYQCNLLSVWSDLVVCILTFISTCFLDMQERQLLPEL